MSFQFALFFVLTIAVKNRRMLAQNLTNVLILVSIQISEPLAVKTYRDTFV